VHRAPAGLFAAVAMLAACGSSGPTRSDQVVASASAVDIRAAGCQPRPERGSGAVIKGGLVLTAAHVVAGATTITVKASGAGDSNGAHLVAIDPANDLALLAVPGLTLPGLGLDTARSGDAGVTIVFRDDAPTSLPFTITNPAVVTLLDIYGKDEVDRDGYVVGVDIEAGDSGAVLVSGGHAVGVLYADSRHQPHRAFASDVSAVLQHVGPYARRACSRQPG